VPFEDIGRVLDRSPRATIQLAHRARRKVQGRAPDGSVDPVRQAAVVEAFLAASRAGEFEALVALLHPDITLVADDTVVAMGAPAAAEGADGVARLFSGRAHAAQAVLVDGRPGVAWIVGGTPRVVWDLVIESGRVTAIDMLADPELLTSLDIHPLPVR
jgi:RNA polymerase sigma-70 factor (ECF subfamily)